ncbi:MAG: WGR domain-containing protein, partial [Actinomycetota bacterium]
MRRFEFVGDGSEKFWEVERDGTAVTVRFGRLGTNGQSRTKDLATQAAASAHLDKLVAEKTGKGYVETPTPAAATPAVPPAATPAVRPQGTPAVPPAATPAVPPQGTPAVPPAATPAVPPAATPAATPQGTPAVPPAATP